MFWSILACCQFIQMVEEEEQEFSEPGFGLAVLCRLARIFDNLIQSTTSTLSLSLKEVGLRYDDDLTRLQQSQRQGLSADFNTLKTIGHKPFYRGSSSVTKVPPRQ